MSGSTCAVSVCGVGYEALTEYRNSFAGEDGQVGRFTRVAFECGYAGLVPLGALETLVRAVCAAVIKVIAYTGCLIPLTSVDTFFGNLDNYFNQVSLSVITCATGTAASARGLVSNLWTAGAVDAGAETQAVEKFGRKHLVNDFNATMRIKRTAKPFSLIALKAITEWRNGFVDNRTEEVFTTTKVFKQLAAVPLYLGVAALSNLETTVRTVYTVALFAFYLFGLSLVLPVAGLTRLLGPLPLTYQQRVNNHGESLVRHMIGMASDTGYSHGILGASLLSLKDNFIKNNARTNDFGQIDYRKQIDLTAQVTRGCIRIVGKILGAVISCVFVSSRLAMHTFVWLVKPCIDLMMGIGFCTAALVYYVTSTLFSIIKGTMNCTAACVRVCVRIKCC
jgi:hypothetical protein